MQSKLFIGNLSFNISDAALGEFFSGMNIPVESVRIVRDSGTGRSRGFAFVELPPAADMQAAILQLNGKILDGRPLTVNEARQQKPRDLGGGRFERNRNPYGRRGPRSGGDRRRAD